MNMYDVPTAEEMVRSLTEIGGLPPPPNDASVSDFHAWTVASFFIRFCRSAKDPAQIRDRSIDAANFLLTNHTLQEREDLRPHIERALGRPLSNEEVKAGKLSERAVSGGQPGQIFEVVVPEHDSVLAELSDLL